LIVRRAEVLSRLIEHRQQGQTGADAPEYLTLLPPVPLQAQSLDVALRLNYLELLCYSEGKIDDALKYGAWALSATARACGQDSVLAGPCLNDYSRVLRAAGRTAEAERFERLAYEVVTQNLARQAAALVP